MDDEGLEMVQILKSFSDIKNLSYHENESSWPAFIAHQMEAICARKTLQELRHPAIAHPWGNKTDS
jgi:hypothetical protein